MSDISPAELGAVTAVWRDMEGAVELVRAYLEGAIPLVAEAMAEGGQPLERVPNVVRAAGAEDRVEHWPEVNVVAMDVLAVTLVDAGSPSSTAPAVPSLATPVPVAGVQYWVTYAVRVYHRVRGQDYADTAAQRDRLAKAIRLALLVDLGLGVTDGTVAVDPTSLTGSFSDVSRSRDRSIAAGYTDLRARLGETLPYSKVAVAGTITTTEGLLAHPALQ